MTRAAVPVNGNGNGNGQRWTRGDIVSLAVFLLLCFSAAGTLIVNYVQGRLSEIETQFKAESDAESGERADSARIQQLLWRRVYNEELPAKNPYMRGPVR